MATRIHIPASLILGSEVGTEKLIALLLWHPNSLVGHINHDDTFVCVPFISFTLVKCNWNFNSFSFRRELDGITNKIGNNLLNAVHVKLDQLVFL